MNKTVPESLDFLKQLNPGVVSDVVDIVLFPPAVSLAVMAEPASARDIALGAQNIHAADAGAFTGEISAEMISSAGCSYVLIGHSERRTFFHETNEMLAPKLYQALSKDLQPVYCVGENMEQRELNQHELVVRNQIQEGLGGLTSDHLARVVIAYEPVWAIGTGMTASPEDAQAMHAMIREELSRMGSASMAEVIPILYGGSMKAANAQNLMEQPDIDGGLIGGASLDPDHFHQIIDIAQRLRRNH